MILEEVMFILVFVWMLIHMQNHQKPQNSYIACSGGLTNGRQIYDYLRAKGYYFGTVHTAVVGTTKSMKK